MAEFFLSAGGVHYSLSIFMYRSDGSFYCFFLFQLTFIRMDNSNDIWFAKADKDAKLLEIFNKTFGNDDFVLITVESRTSVDPDTIGLIKNLVDALKGNVPYLKDVVWLGRLPHPFKLGDFGEPRVFFDPIPKTMRLLDDELAQAVGHPLYLNQFISPDKKVLGLFVQMEPYPQHKVDPRKEVFPALRKVLEKPEYQPLILHAVGGPVLDYEFDTIVVREMIFFIGFILLIMTVVLMWLGRGLRGVLVPLVTVSLSILWTLGLMSLLGFKLNLLTIMVPILLITTGIANSIHIIVALHDQWDQGLEREQALLEAVSMVGFPCLLTSITTAIGFLSFLSTPIKAFKEMGMYAACGVLMGFLVTVTLVVCLFSFGQSKPVSSKKASASKDIFARFLSFTFRINMKFQKPIILFFLIIVAVCSYGITKVEFESNFIEMFSKKLSFRQTYDHVDKQLGGSMALEIMVDTGIQNGVKDPEFIQQVNRFQQEISRHPLTTKVTSYLDRLRMIDIYFKRTGFERAELPDTIEKLKTYFYYYKKIAEQEMNAIISSNSAVARITVRTKSLGTRDVRSFLKNIESFSGKIFDKGVKVETTGYMAWIRTLNDKLHQGLFWSFSVALFGIMVVMTMILKSFRLGLISMLPNIIPVLVVLGSMGLSGLDVDIPLMCIAAIVIGISVDDTVHFFTRFKNEFAVQGTYERALKNTLNRVGRPITYTTLILVIGLILLVFSSINAFIKFGVLSGLAFTWALLADFYLVPCLLLLFKPFGPERF